LPPLGSFQERLISEAILREKNEKFAMVSMFATLISAVGQLDGTIVDDLLEEYKEELYQLKYNFKYTRIRQRRITERVSKAADEARLMQRVESMTYRGQKPDD